MSNSKYLMETPNFEWSPSLERLDFTGCTNLRHVHSSIGLLKQLFFLSFRNCRSLVRLDLGNKCRLCCLRVLHLSGCTNLESTPDFTGLLNLEYLDLECCSSLSEVHESIGALESLKFLSFRNCRNLVRLDLGNKCRLCCLRVLHLSGCTNLESTPDFTGLLNLEYLDLECCSSLSEVHESIGALESLKFLSLKHCTNLGKICSSFNRMRSLITLDLCGCVKLCLSLGEMVSCRLQSLIFLDLGFCNLSKVPEAIENLSCLERLNLEGNNIVSLPFAISRLSSLAYLNLSHCKKLRCFPECPSKSGSSVGRYFKSVSGSRNHRSGLYAFNCPGLDDEARSPIYIATMNIESVVFSWLVRLAQVRDLHAFILCHSLSSSLPLILPCVFSSGIRIPDTFGAALTLLFLGQKFHNGSSIMYLIRGHK